jgi:ABC-2 type transport system permease protein
MQKLLTIEWMKIKNYRAFWVFGILYFVSILGINYTGYYINSLTMQNVPQSTLLLGTPYGFPKVWQTVGWMSSWLLYFPGILFIMLLTNEFNFKTHRQNIIDGWNRTQFISVKFVFALIFSVAGTLFNAIVALLFGWLTSGAPNSTEGLENIGYIFIQTSAYISFAMFLAVIFRKSGVAIAVFFLFGLIFEFIISGLINFKLGWAPIGYFLPLQVTDVMIPIPFGNKIIYKDAPPMYSLLIASALFMSAYYFFSLRKFQKEDL